MSAPATGGRAHPREAGAPYCDQCGAPEGTPDHPRCAARRELEPPRFCPDCARRMAVQVDPVGWTARCSRHGERTSSS
ncbi:hypothetical protein WHI96_10155 [Pseudonocardia tropica]|uniref:Biotin synthase auxiliary protein n=1 Tax=Pseudonocardia tropica TaxID=681289 RepID=A0ABV1JTA4_9PSEU